MNREVSGRFFPKVKGKEEEEKLDSPAAIEAFPELILIEDLAPSPIAIPRGVMKA